MGKYFGTDGFRGKAGETITADHAFFIGRYLGYHFKKLKKNPKVLLGKDPRLSSSMLEAAMVAGLVASGSDCHLLHMTTTPAVSYLTRTMGYDAGIMISASHNPYYDNGIKIMNDVGEKMDESLLLAIEHYLDTKEPEIPFVTGEHLGTIVSMEKIHSCYLGFLSTLVRSSFEGFRVGLDCANGGASVLAQTLLENLGARVYVIHNQPNGININEDCGSTHTASLRKFVKDNRLDVGFAFDGDGDRCIAVDENGKEVNGDVMMYVIAKTLKEHNQLPSNTVVTTVMSNLGLYKALDKADIGYEKTAVGDRYVYESMKAYDHIFGGEQSGHLIFRKYARTGDGLITAIVLLNVMAENALPLSELAKPVKLLPQILKNARVDDKDAAFNHPLVRDAVRDCTKQLGANGRVLLRKSGTESVLRVMAEAQTQSVCEDVLERIFDAIRQTGHLVGENA